MTVADLKLMLQALPDNFAVTIEHTEEKHIQSVSLSCGRLVLRDHVLSIGTYVETVTAYDGVEYVVDVNRTKYPTVIPIRDTRAMLAASVKRLQ